MIKYSSDNSKLVCSFSGRMDTVKTAEIENEIFEKTRDSKNPVVFDLKEVDYVSSSFLRICLRMARDRGKGNFSIIHVSPLVQKVFKIAGFDKLMTIE